MPPGRAALRTRSPAERPHGRAGPRGAPSPSLTQETPGRCLVGSFAFFKGTGEKGHRDYWCIKRLRKLCLLKLLHFLPDATERLFNKVSLCFS